ncbi:conserved hypothetical protein [Vibrio harveyi]|uniref:hypothetical protein n=1 Tax=Vibrio harveyi TaxID=669 RepID=UPI002ADCCDEA|nr:hypothetical protein [Vibrio harveyi]CAK6712086.1 conserved hypothetical protein [Vibrio harveyi]
MRFSKIKKLFEIKDELEIEYLYGYKFEETPHLITLKHQSLFVQLLKVLKLILNPIIFWGGNDLRKSDYWFFFNTVNQKNSLEKISNKFENKGQSVLRFSFNRKMIRDRYELMAFSITDVLFAITFLFLRLPSIVTQLRKTSDPLLLIKSNLLKYIQLYFYASFFSRNLEKNKPKVIFISNDHNGEHRIIIYIAKLYNVKVAYIQHAHISPLYPPLSMDMAFLDGRKSLDIYSKLAKEQGRTSIYLTGNQKKLPRLNRISRLEEIKTIGIAVNLFDNLHRVELFLESIPENISVNVRFHPTQDVNFMDCLIKKFGKISNFTFHKAQDVSITTYFKKVDILFAGESSIHLESALSGVISFIVNFTDVDFKDFYGFFSGGICLKYELATFRSNALDLSFYTHNTEKICQYSSTYQTSYQGREDELVFETIKKVNSEEVNFKVEQTKSGKLYII